MNTESLLREFLPLNWHLNNILTHCDGNNCYYHVFHIDTNNNCSSDMTFSVFNKPSPHAYDQNTPDTKVNYLITSHT